MKFKRMIALLIVGVLAVSPLTVNAASGEATVDGNNVAQFDNSVPPSYCNVVLPVATRSTFEMELDPQEAMKTVYDGYEDGETINFKVESVGLGLDAKNGTLNSVSFAESSLTTFNASVTINSQTLNATISGTYYVWAPVSLTIPQSGPGEFVKITSSNIERYFDIETDTTSIALKNRNGASVNDGKVYTSTYVPIVAFEDYASYDYENDTVILGPEEMYVETGGVYTALGTNALALSQLDVVAPVLGKEDESDKLKIINKASTATIVTVEARMGNIADIRFSADAGFTNTSDMLYLNLDGDKTTGMAFGLTSAIATEALANIVIELDGAGQDSAIHYVGYEGDLGDKYGINWYQYEAALGTYDEAEFWLAGDTNYTTDAAKAAWEKYIKNGNGRSTISLTYKFANAYGEVVEEPAEEEPVEETRVTVTLNSLGSITLTASDAVPQLFGGNKDNYTITGSFGSPSETHPVNMKQGSGAAASASANNKSVTLTLPGNWGTTAGWHKLVITGVAAGNSTIVLTKEGADTGLGKVTVEYTPAP